MGVRFVLLFAALAALLGQAARADIRSDAVRLLARRVRASGVDPKNVTVSGVVVRGNQALLSWDSGRKHGLMGLVTSGDRWWDALDMSLAAGCWDAQSAYPLVSAGHYPASYTPADFRPPPTPETLLSYGLSKDLVSAAARANADVRTAAGHCNAATYEVEPDVQIRPGGGTLHSPIRVFTSGYDITIGYSRNDASPDAKLAQLFARAPTQAEFAPNHPPAPGWGGPDAVCFFDIGVGGAKPVTFEPGTTVEVWFPFVLDDQLRYNLSFFSAGKPSGMIFGTLFDNTLHFVLPRFTIDPHDTLMAEIDGDVKGSP
jgi:hypothetical protein